MWDIVEKFFCSIGILPSRESFKKPFIELDLWSQEIRNGYAKKHKVSKTSANAIWASTKAEMAVRNYGYTYGLPDPIIYRQWPISKFI